MHKCAFYGLEGVTVLQAVGSSPTARFFVWPCNLGALRTTAPGGLWCQGFLQHDGVVATGVQQATGVGCLLPACLA